MRSESSSRAAVGMRCRARRPSARSLAAIPPVAALGMSVAAVLVAHHRGGSFGASFLGGLCGAEGSGCDAVNRSAVSELLGVPTALWGFAFYGVVAVLGVVALLEEHARALRWILRLAIAGAAVDLALLAYSLIALRTVCAACGLTYVVTGSLVALALAALRREGLDWRVVLLRGPGPGPGRGDRPLRAVIAFGLTAVAAASGLVLTGSRASAAAASASDPEKALAVAWTAFLERYRETPPVPIEIGASPTRGPTDPILSLVVFSDFECGACRRAAGMLGRFADRLGGAVRLTLKHYPLDSTCNPAVSRPIHPGAGELARAAQAAQHLGRFWPLHDLLFANQERFETSVSTAHLAFLAKRVGLDPARFADEMDSPSVVDEVRRDIDLANRLGINGTPTLFVNGRRLGSIPPEEFLEQLAREEVSRQTAAVEASQPLVRVARPRHSRGAQAPRDEDKNETKEVRNKR